MRPDIGEDTTQQPGAYQPAGMYNATGTTGTADPDTDSDNASTDEAAAGGEIQESGLNGAQIEGLLQIVEAITAGQLTPKLEKSSLGKRSRCSILPRLMYWLLK